MLDDVMVEIHYVDIVTHSAVGYELEFVKMG